MHIEKREGRTDRERESAVNRESEREKGIKRGKYAEHIWAANLSALLNNFGPLVDWLTGLQAGWPEGQMDRGKAGQGDRQATVCFSHMTHGGHKSCMWRMANECANNSIKNNKKRITSVPRVTAVCVRVCW